MLNRRMFRKSAAVLLLSLGMTGCSGLLDSKEPAASQWWLEPTPLGGAGALPFDAVALDMDVVPGLDTDRILNLDGQARLNHYAGAHWPEHLPEVLESLLIRSLETRDNTRARAATRSADGECLLRLEATAFYGRLDAAGVTNRVEVAFSGALDCDGQRRDLGAQATETVTDNRMSAIVAAFQAALDRSVKDLAAQMGGA